MDLHKISGKMFVSLTPFTEVTDKVCGPFPLSFCSLFNSIAVISASDVYL